MKNSLLLQHELHSELNTFWVIKRRYYINIPMLIILRSIIVKTVALTVLTVNSSGETPESKRE